ncbi:MAG: DUF1772 domain-containing protein [Acidobacteriota bacterium]|nr:MAG: DUF1772 domain-containing protein [Acidobacteriota bacterium]
MLELILIITALLVSLVAGFLFAFAVVVMPGVGKMDDLRFVETFRAIDRVIQNNSPLFLLVWAGSGVGSIASAVVGLLYLQGVALAFTLTGCAVFIALVHVPTVAVNVPLNNRLQALDPEKLSVEELKEARNAFEKPWLFWNTVRTVASVLALAMLLACLTTIGR